jgi:hypothetical protein
VHTGGQDYVKMYEKNKSRLKVYIEKATWKGRVRETYSFFLRL